MFINNAIYKAIPTTSLTFPLAEGTVVTAGGVTGIVTENLAQPSPTATIFVAVGGTIDLKSPANKDVSFTDEQIKALGSDFNFVPAEEGNGGGGSSLPQVTSDDNGDVLAVVDGEWSKAPAPSSLPAYTDADKGKVPTVVEAEAGTVVVIPEQTVTTDSEGVATLIGVDYSNLVSGQIVSVTMSAGGQSGTLDMYYNDNALYLDETFSGDPWLDGSVIYGEPNTELTISATYSEYMPELSWTVIIPALPSANGDYVLRIRDGVASWYSAE